jgi:predicted transcriptional regulator
MPRRELHELGALQREVMETVWTLGEVTVHDVRAALPGAKDHAYTTVLTVLQKLEKAGWITHRREGRTYVWSALRTREREGRTSLGKVIDRLFEGSPMVAFQHLLEDDRLDGEDLLELRRLVERKRREKGAGR